MKIKEHHWPWKRRLRNQPQLKVQGSFRKYPGAFEHLQDQRLHSWHTVDANTVLEQGVKALQGQNTAKRG